MISAEIFFWLAITALILYLFYDLLKRSARRTKFHTRTAQGEVLDIDLRLPYKRFKELYPWSKITYAEYKKLQMARAFKKAIGSETNRRMVR